MNQRKLLLLRIGVLVPTFLFIYLYALDPLHKYPNLIAIAVIFTVLLLLAAIVFRKNDVYRIICYYAVFVLLTLSYLIL